MEKMAPALRKRNQIRQANRAMLLWIAGMSVVVGISIVLVVFLAQKIWFGEKVISEKNATVSTLEKNLTAVKGLRDNVRVLNTNQALIDARLNDEDSPLQTVLDALPADANPTALATSLQAKLLTGIPNIVMETIDVQGTGTDDSTASGDGTSSYQLPFSFSVSTDTKNNDSLRQVLERLEKSIRPFNVTALSIEGQGDRIVMTVAGVSYYDPAKTVQLIDKVVKP